MIDNKKLISILEAIQVKIHENAQFLTELDAAIGDSDHGINLDRGFSKVIETKDSLSELDCGAILKKVGMTLVSTVGGASGPLYGTAFMKAGGALAGKNELNFEDFLLALKEAIGGVKMRGKGEKGEKTMLDAMIPALEIMEENKTLEPKQALELGVKAAQEGVEYTKTIIATKGRASYLGERSLGHQDPGATSFTYLLQAIQESL